MPTKTASKCTRRRSRIRRWCEKLGVYLVRVLPDTGQGADPNDPMFLHVATPDGKTGYADAQLISPLGSDQMCYSKDATGWKIAGYFGGAAPQ